jgi:pSer/pThr/pTyr-binding forkhead associated (FHA) protein
MPTMDVKLVVEKGASRTPTLHLRSEETIVGRRQGCDIRIPSASVSRRHCLLSFREGYLSVEDLDSANGTFLNGETVAGRQVVRPGDRLQIGPITFVVEYQLTQDAIDRLRDEEEAAFEVLEDKSEEAAMWLDVKEEPETVPPQQPDPKDKADPEEREEEEEVGITLDENERWELPDPDSLRDILSRMDDK